MDYSRPDMADRLAAEYVLGTLHGPARRRFESLLPAHPALRRATTDWERRLLQLSNAAPAVQPSAEVWEKVQRRLFGERQAIASAATGPVRHHRTRWWQGLALWQGATALATATAVWLSVGWLQPAPLQAPVVVVMSAQAGPGTDAQQPASFVASVSGDGRTLVLKPLNGVQAVALNKALELWAVPAKGAPRSLGVVSPTQATTVVRARLLTDTAAFAVSVEPPGGSPSGAPTGPIISVGNLQL